jgi:LEA14-like dessication related protein
MYRAFAAILLLVIFTSQIRALDDRKPDVHLKSVSVKGIDLSKRTADAELSIAIDNPGPAFELKDLNYRLTLNDRQAAEGKYPSNIKVPAHSTTTFDLPCIVDLSTLPGVAWGIIAGGFDVHYELQTEFTVPLFPSFNPRIKSSMGGDLSLSGTVAGWTARIKERISKE